MLTSYPDLVDVCVTTSSLREVLLHVAVEVVDCGLDKLAVIPTTDPLRLICTWKLV